MIVRRKGDVKASRVHGGGHQGPDGFVFELCGGRLCLDFVNTLDERPRESPIERLGTYKDWTDWSIQTGILERREAEALLTRAQRSPAQADAAVARARLAREALFEIFSSVLESREPRPRAAKRLDDELREAYARPSLERDAAGYRLDWRTNARSFHRMLHPVIHSAVALLTSPELDRLRMCSSETCAWLYLDETRNRSRRWCDMAVCGNREKARRFYRRQKARPG